MRFSHFLKYNAVPEWQSHYMDYIALKNLIYTLQSDELKQTGGTISNNDSQEVLDDSQQDREQSQTPSGKDFRSKIKDRFFKNKRKSKRKNSSPEQDNDKKSNAVEETIELDDLSLGPTRIRDHIRNPFTTNLKTKMFESRRSSESSETRTIYSPYDSFVSTLEDERVKIDDFYKRTEAKFYERFDSLLSDLDSEGIISFEEVTARLSPTNPGTEAIKSRILNSSKRQSTNSFDMRMSNENHELRNRFDLSEEDFDEDEDEEVEYGIDGVHENSALLNYSQVNIKSQKKSILKQSIIYLYIDLCQLKSFIELNTIGFSKITKKFDKVLQMSTRAELIDTGVFFKGTYTFEESTLNILNQKIRFLVEFYALITEQADNFDGCKQELRSFLHDHIVWERSKTWKDMLGLVSEDKQIRADLDIVDEEAAKKKEKLNTEFYLWQLPKPIHWKFIHVTSIGVPKLFFTMKAAKLAFIITFTGILLGVKTFNDRVEGRCMALVECVAFLWAFEAIPLHITAFLVPLLTVLFKVLKDDNGKAMGAADASSVILASMWSSTIMILLAGFTLGEALAQYDVARILASWLLAFAGTKPRNVILMAMAVVFFLSMWISNVASPVLTYSLLSPLLDNLEGDVPFAKALVMGVALAADIGGMSSPISSPQNIISMEYLKPYGIGWGQFFAVALPCGILATLGAWGIMCTTFKINSTKLEKFTPIRTKLTVKQWYIIVVTIATIILWCVESQIEGAFGSSGQIAILPIVLLFGTGLLSTKDINSFPWSIVILAMGGIALGKAVSSSGLLTTVARALQRKIENDGLLAILCIFGILMLVIGTFVSHTVSAIIIVPLVQEVGEKLGSPKAAPILVFGCALLSSCGMGLASSGFPNVTAISLTDKKGNRYLDVLTFITRGVPASLFAFVCVVTLGYGIMISVVKGVPTTGATTS
ncbi:inorganic phosphate transporter Pho87p [Monosporozyma servazzii]